MDRPLRDLEAELNEVVPKDGGGWEDLIFSTGWHYGLELRLLLEPEDEPLRLWLACSAGSGTQMDVSVVEWHGLDHSVDHEKWTRHFIVGGNEDLRRVGKLPPRHHYIEDPWNVLRRVP